MFAYHPRKDVRKLAKILFNHFGSLQSLFAAPYDVLRSVHIEVTDSVIAVILCFAEVFKRLSLNDMKLNTSNIVADKDCHAISLNSFSSLISYLTSSIAFANEENMKLIYINLKGDILMEDNLSDLHNGMVTINMKKLLLNLLNTGARSLVMAHNHPSGNIEPSKEDLLVTKKVALLCKSLGVVLIDHIILSGNQYFSFHKKGLLKKCF